MTENELRTGLRSARLPIGVAGLALGFFLLLPLLVVIPTSWTASPLIGFPPEGFSGQWYGRIFDDDTWTEPLRVSLRLSVQVSLLATVFGTAAALGMRRLARGRSARIVRSLFVLPLAIPYVSYALGIYDVFLRLPAGLGDSFLPLILAQSMITFPLVYVVVAGALSGVDPNLGRAAATLGARWPWIVWRIELPLIRTAIIAAFIFAFATSFEEATLAIFLAPVGELTFAQQLYRATAESFEPTLAAVSTLTTLAAFVVLGVGSLLVGVSARRGRR